MSGHDVIHATAVAVEMVKLRTFDPEQTKSRWSVAACDLSLFVGARPAFAGKAAAEVIRFGSISRSGQPLPTCQHCRVLLDEAWENPAETT